MKPLWPCSSTSRWWWSSLWTWWPGEQCANQRDESRVKYNQQQNQWRSLHWLQDFQKGLQKLQRGTLNRLLQDLQKGLENLEGPPSSSSKGERTASSSKYGVTHQSKGLQFKERNLLQAKVVIPWCIITIECTSTFSNGSKILWQKQNNSKCSYWFNGWCKMFWTRHEFVHIFWGQICICLTNDLCYSNGFLHFWEKNLMKSSFNPSPGLQQLLGEVQLRQLELEVQDLSSFQQRQITENPGKTENLPTSLRNRASMISYVWIARGLQLRRRNPRWRQSQNFPKSSQSSNWWAKYKYNRQIQAQIESQMLEIQIQRIWNPGLDWAAETKRTGRVLWTSKAVAQVLILDELSSSLWSMLWSSICN